MSVMNKGEGSDFDGKAYKAASRHQKEWGHMMMRDLRLQGDENIIDLGCGDGVLTRQLADLVPRGSVLGIDSSPSMIEAARELEGGNLRFEVRDINELRYNSEFDLAYSNACLHWVKDHRRLLENVHYALVKDGRARFDFAGDGNCSNFFAVVRSVMSLPRYHDNFAHMEWPWYMPTLQAYEGIVAEANFSTHRVWTEDRDRYFTEKELVGWIDQPSIVPFLALVEGADRVAFRDAVVTAMKERTRKPDGRYFETFRRMNLYAEK